MEQRSAFAAPRIHHPANARRAYQGDTERVEAQTVPAGYAGYPEFLNRNRTGGCGRAGNMPVHTAVAMAYVVHVVHLCVRS